MKKLFALAATAAMFTGCAGYYGAPVVPPGGWAYSNISAPIDVDANDTKMEMKVGRSQSKSILGLVALGDCSATSAARDGGITRLHHMDYEFKNILGIYSTFTTVAYGE